MIAILLADGFEEAEALVPADLLRRAGIEVKLISVKSSPEVTGGHGIRVLCDGLLSESDKADGLLLPGGMAGVQGLSACARETVVQAARDGKWIFAICAAPTLLSSWGLTEGKKVTCYPDLKEKMKGQWLDQKVVTDGRLVTSQAAGTATDFALTLIALLKGEKAAQQVKSSIYYR